MSWRDFIDDFIDNDPEDPSARPPSGKFTVPRLKELIGARTGRRVPHSGITKGELIEIAQELRLVGIVDASHQDGVAAKKKTERGGRAQRSTAGLSLNTLLDPSRRHGQLDEPDVVRVPVLAIIELRHASEVMRDLAILGSRRTALLLRSHPHIDTVLSSEVALRAFVRRVWYASTTTTRARPIYATADEERDVFGNLRLSMRRAGGSKNFPCNVFKLVAHQYAASIWLHLTDLSRVIKRVSLAVRCLLYWQFQTRPLPGQRKNKAAYLVATALRAGTNIARGDDAVGSAQCALVQIRAMLQMDRVEPLTDDWLEANAARSLAFSLSVLELVDDAKAKAQKLVDDGVEKVWHPKAFVFIPTCKIARGRRFITLDKTSIKQFGFDFEAIKRRLEEIGLVNEAKGVSWTGTLTTDGYSCNVHLHKPAPKKPAKKRKKLGGDGGSDGGSSRSRVRMYSVAPNIMISIDPGRNNLATAVIWINGEVVFKFRVRVPPGVGVRRRPESMILSAVQHRMETGATRHMAIERSKLKKEQLVDEVALHEALTASSSRTNDLDSVRAHMAASITLGLKRVCTRNDTSRRRSSRCKRRASMLAFFTRLKRRAEKLYADRCPNARLKSATAVIVWGDASVKHTGLGRAPAPCKTIQQVARQVFCRPTKGGGPRWEFEYGSEWCTTKNACFEPYNETMAVRVRKFALRSHVIDDGALKLEGIAVSAVGVARASDPRARRRPPEVRKAIRAGVVDGDRRSRALRDLRLGRVRSGTQATEIWIFDGHEGDGKAFDANVEVRAIERCFFV